MLFRFFAAAALLLPPHLSGEPQIESVAGQATFAVEYDRTSDLSGITWLGGENFYAVSNKARAMFPLKLEIAPQTGRISQAKFGAKIPLKTDYSDLEGIAWQPEKKRVYLSSESSHGIVGFDAEGDAKFAVEVPAVFRNARSNRSLESLTFGADAFWTANEGTLEGDGSPSSPTHGGVVRLQKFDGRFKPLAQFAYRTEASLVPNGTGVTDLCALPNGDLLVLERVVGAGLTARIFRVDVEGATDTSSLPRLEDVKFTPVRKKLLFERHGTANFEGIALGPELDDGWRSLILVADNGGNTKHVFMPLRIRLEPPGATPEK